MKTVIFTLLLFLPQAYAGTIYKWYDEFGKVHFTDNLANVPLSQEDVKEKKLESPKVKVSETKISKVDAAQGEIIWKQKCIQCHAVTAGHNTDDRRLLPDSIALPPLPVDELAKSLAKSLDLRSGDMDGVTLDENELKAVSSYIIQEAKLNP